MPEPVKRPAARSTADGRGEPPRPVAAPAPRAPARRRLKEHARLVAAVFLGALAAIFAVLNLDDVRVNWILGSWSTPLIVVIAVSFLLGVAADRLLRARRGPRARRR